MISVKDVVVDEVIYDKDDYPDFCDAYVSKAHYKDTGEELVEDDLKDVNYEFWFVWGEVMKRYK